MSRIAKQPIKIPTGVKVVQAGRALKVTGPLGELSRSFREEIAFTVDGQAVTVAPVRTPSLLARALWGTYAAHLKNMITGVTSGFTKKLVIEGIGYKVNLAGPKLTFSLGLSHPVEIMVPAGIKMTVEKNLLTITGTDREAVGQFAATLRDLKPPEPYKGKGIHYEGEVIRRKQGKKAVG